MILMILTIDNRNSTRSLVENIGYVRTNCEFAFCSGVVANELDVLFSVQDLAEKIEYISKLIVILVIGTN